MGKRHCSLAIAVQSLRTRSNEQRLRESHAITGVPMQLCLLPQGTMQDPGSLRKDTLRILTTSIVALAHIAHKYSTLQLLVSTTNCIH